MNGGVTLTEPQGRALRLVAEHGSMTLVTARRLLVNESTLRSLERRGLLSGEWITDGFARYKRWTPAP